jgi:hypothetical protein
VAGKLPVALGAACHGMGSTGTEARCNAGAQGEAQRSGYCLQTFHAGRHCSPRREKFARCSSGPAASFPATATPLVGTTL